MTQSAPEPAAVDGLPGQARLRLRPAGVRHRQTRAGHGYRVNTNGVKRELALGGELQRLALRYAQAWITQMAQSG